MWRDSGRGKGDGGGDADRVARRAQDAKRTCNRAEHVRQIPPGDPDFEVQRGGATTPNASTATSTTRCGYGVPTLSCTVTNC